MSEIVEFYCRPCPFCGNRAMVEVDLDGLLSWLNGELVQRALPDLNAVQRELLISGVHEHCWEANMGSEEDGLRTCDGCGLVEDAGTFPDQDGLGRSECCWEVG